MTYFVERLTVWNWLARVLPILKDKPGRCWVVDGSLVAMALARRTAPGIGADISRLAFRMIDVRDRQGLSIRLQLSFRDSAEIQRDILAEPHYQKWLSSVSGGPRLEAYMAKCVTSAANCEDDANLWRAIYLIQVCEWKLAQGEGVEGTIFLYRRHFFAALERFAARHGMKVAPMDPPWKLKPILRRCLGPRGMEVLRHLRRHGWRAPISFLRASRRPAAPDADAAPKLAVEFTGLLNLDDPRRQSNLLFCRGDHGPRPQDVLVVFGSPHAPLTPARLAEVRGHGMDALAIHAAASEPRLPSFSPRLTPPAPHPACGPDSQWLKERTQEYNARRSFWSELCSTRGIKAFVTWQAVDETHCAIADGIQDAGGVTAIYQRSLEVPPSPQMGIHSDIHFSFARDGAELGRQNGSSIRYNVVTGFLSDCLFAPLRKEAEHLRQRLQSHGARHIVAMFDENSKDDPRWHTGHEVQRRNYALLLEKVLAEPWLGLVIKPKHPSTLRRRLGPLAQLLAQAETTGRCHIFESGFLYADYPPAAAALAADVAIHGHLCAATAAMEAALVGIPTLVIDQEGWSVSPLYQLGLGRVVFKSWSDCWDALSEHWNSPGGIPGFGDWSDWLPRLDPFRDGRAAERMGGFLAHLMEGFHQGLSRDAAMARAAERYAEAWGSDKISEVRSALLRSRRPVAAAGSRMT